MMIECVLQGRMHILENNENEEGQAVSRAIRIDVRALCDIDYGITNQKVQGFAKVRTQSRCDK